MSAWIVVIIQSLMIFIGGVKFSLETYNKLCIHSHNTKRQLQTQPQEVFCKKMLFIEVSQNAQENTCARVFF